MGLSRVGTENETGNLKFKTWNFFYSFKDNLHWGIKKGKL
jgi:hypothetical protein